MRVSLPVLVPEVHGGTLGRGESPGKRTRLVRPVLTLGEVGAVGHALRQQAAPPWVMGALDVYDRPAPSPRLAYWFRTPR